MQYEPVTQDAGATASPTARPHKGRIIISSLVGTSIEFYDFYVYATAAISVFPFLFFHSDSDTGALLASLATFGVGYVARPIGSFFMGYIGDRVGRKALMMLTLLMMGIGTFLIGCLPTYDQIGMAAPVLLVGWTTATSSASPPTMSA